MIDSDKIYSYFNEHHGPLEQSTNGWYIGMCPFCRSRKLAVNPGRFAVKCWKKCYSGGVVGFVKEYLGCDHFDAYLIIDDMVPRLRVMDYMSTKPTVRKELVLPEGYHQILEGYTPMASRARNYLKLNRGFDLNYLDMIGVGYCDGDTYFGYIIIPFKKDGEIVYFIGRDFMDRGEGFRYKNPPTEIYGIGKSEVIFNEEALWLYDKVYLLEGWTDAATIGNNACSTQGKDLSIYQADIIINSPVKEVVVISDLGAEMAALNMLEKLYKYKKTKLLKLTEFKEFGKDVNAIGVDRVLGLEPKAAYITNLESFYNEARSINPRKKKLLN